MLHARFPGRGTARSNAALTTGYAAGVVLIAAAIEATGGLPSQYAHFYYLPVVLSALTLPVRFSLALALLASLAVSPAPELSRALLGLDAEFANAEPWIVTPDGWIVRPIAFFAISLLAHEFVVERWRKETILEADRGKGEELGVLSSIDKMILSGADEDQAVREISRLVSDLTRAKVAGVVTASGGDKPEQMVRGFTRDGVQSRFVERSGLPYGEGVSGWVLIHGHTATSRNVFTDSRYETMTEVARSVGQRAAAAVPIVLDGEILGALMVGYEEEREFDPSELATLERLADQAAIAISNARQRQSLRDIALGTAVALADVIESRDAYTGDHSSRLVTYSSLIAEELRMNAKELETIRLGAALHDVGKIAVPDEVLKKPGKLTPEEFSVIRQHCYVGGQICKKIPFLAEVYPIVYHHHESFDGSGYPDGLRGEGIPLGARIVAVADAYDAMTSDRVYRKALGHERAVDILDGGRGKQWDPEIVTAFLAASSRPILRSA